MLAQAHAEAAPTPEQIDQGREVYEDNCETCHGRDMVSPGLVTFDLRKFPKDDPARFRGSVLDGKGTAMPAFRGRISDEEVTCCGPMCGAGRSDGLENCRPRRPSIFLTSREFLNSDWTRRAVFWLVALEHFQVPFRGTGA